MRTLHTEIGIMAPAGTLSTPVMWLVGKATREDFEVMNRALKARAESL